jgi:dephospho-CoA kinase
VSVRPLRIGVTGPIGCGKSTVARWLEAEGALVIDADRLAREVTDAGDPSIDAIRGRFGSGVIRGDGSLDRSALASIVFSDEAALHDLEAILHPQIRHRLVAEVARAEAAGFDLVVVEAIKLVEAGYAADCDEVWIIDCRSETQLERLRSRGTTGDDAQRRMAAQGAALADRLVSEAASLVGPGRVRRIATDGPPEAVWPAVSSALADLRARRPQGLG